MYKVIDHFADPPSRNSSVVFLRNSNQLGPNPQGAIFGAMRQSHCAYRCSFMRQISQNFGTGADGMTNRQFYECIEKASNLLVILALL